MTLQEHRAHEKQAKERAEAYKRKRVHGKACDTFLFGGDDARPIGGCDCEACDEARYPELYEEGE